MLSFIFNRIIRTLLLAVAVSFSFSYVAFCAQQEPVDEDLFKFTGSIEDLLLFIYNEVLKYKNYTLDDIIKDPKELNENAEIYLKKEW